MNKQASVIIRKFAERNKLSYNIIKKLYNNTPAPQKNALKTAMLGNLAIDDILQQQADSSAAK